ncbi:protein asteroid homolog 1-like isoform X1 [Gadus macrocephalus]|uniref:protein asteroid homolog 1-like isoform X1 n=2 Tax=Gadus macrocephalus TaxID=80720 RepID=UPI0028CB940D|nr:protein asteroid homolog 1-like isoform X1 [Gadus macrocephalus]
MGVDDLCSLLEDYSQIYQDIRFRDSKLVVDGTNLAYDLYYRSNLDQNHGGEYLAFQVEVLALFKALSDCGIKPYVVMDGGSGTSDIKLDTLMDRARGKVWRAQGAALKGRRADILPPISTKVFEQTLNNMKVPLVRCFGEADGQLAALASDWCCPVLSGDTDFYIYDLPWGLLHLDHFQWDSVKKSPTRSYIPCKRYTTSSFCTFFNIDRQLLPVFALLAGNDFVNIREMNWDQNVLAGRQREIELSQTARLEGLLRWMRGFQTIEDTLTAAMDLMPNMSQQVQTEVLTEVQKSMLEYRLPSSSLRGFFSEGTIPSLPAEMLSCVPDWVRAPLARGELGADILDLLVHKRKILPTQVERSDLQSSNLTSRPIRKVLYGLLLGRGGGKVEEVDRVGTKPASVKVQPLVHGAAKTLRLDSLTQADRAVRLQVCLETLGVEEETLEGVPAHLRLPVAVTRYWLRRASPEPTLLKALLMVMVQGELNRRKRLTIGWQGYSNSIFRPLDCVVAHSFNQWQACLKDASQLNLLLCKPLPEPHFAWLYQGRLVHRRQKQLLNREPEEILHSPQFRRLYRRLLGAVTQPDPRANRRAGGPEAQLRASMEHLHLNTQDEDEEEEEEGEELGGAEDLDQGPDWPRVTVGTRYRTKDRKDRSRNPELGRKQEREGWG